MIDLKNINNYHLEIVECKTGVFARGANGHRVVYSKEEQKYIDTDVPSRYVKKKLLKPMHVPIFIGTDDKVIFAIAKASEVSRAGLDWTVIFQATFFRNKARPIFEGQEDLRFWFLGNGAELLLTAWNPESVDGGIVKDDVLFVFFNCCRHLMKEPFNVWTRYKNRLWKWDCWCSHVIERMEQLKKRKFGLEVEFTGMTRKAAADVVARYLQSKVQFTGSYQILDKRNRTWKIVSDSSITAESKKDEEVDSHFRCELVTPVCSYNDIPDIQQIVRELRKEGMIVNESCGIHVHVDSEGHTAESLCVLTDFMAQQEDTIFEALGTLPDREDSYCRKVDKAFLRLIHASKGTISMNDLRLYWYNGGSISRMIDHYDSSRYHAFNLHSLWQGKGIEYRMFNGTTHAGKIKAYIQFCLAITSYPVEFGRVPHFSGSQLEQFSDCLTELGLIGDEFKTARLHLLSILKEKEERTQAA